MINNIRKDIAVNFITDGKTGKCDGCIVRRGIFMADVNQPLCLTASWQEKDFSQTIIYKNVKENYCYSCMVDLCDNWNHIIHETYLKKHLEKVNKHN